MEKWQLLTFSIALLTSVMFNSGYLRHQVSLHLCLMFVLSLILLVSFRLSQNLLLFLIDHVLLRLSHEAHLQDKRSGRLDAVKEF